MAAATESAGSLRRFHERLDLVRPAEEAVMAHQPAACDQLIERKRKLVHVLQIELLVHRCSDRQTRIGDRTRVRFARIPASQPSAKHL